MMQQSISHLTRRQLLRTAGGGAGFLGLASLLSEEGLLATERGGLHHPAMAKNVIWLFLNGGASQVDTFDYKPSLKKYDGQDLPGFDPKSTFFTESQGKLMASPFEFKPYGECGKMISSVFAQTAQHVDSMAFVHSCYAESNNHSPALFQINCGLPRLGFPSVGAWLLYGLGSESRDLPGFVVMTDTKGRGFPKGYAQNWSSGFLPGTLQGTALNIQGDPINDLRRLDSMSDEQQRNQLALLQKLNRVGLNEHPLEDELEARIQSFELAYRMQTAAPETLDIESESESTQNLYGIGQPHCDHFARQCLMARRLVEKGVRMIQIYSGGEANAASWDGHIDILGNHTGFGQEVDQPISALITDLQARGLFESTLIICCGEFGRQPVAQIGAKPGRDHNPFAFTTWFAGGGIRGGVSYGATDEFGYKAEVDKVSIHDLHATVLHLMGIDHEKLTYRFNGRDFRLTDVHGKVISPIVS